ncbi:uncharacterized protein KIAA2013 homolog isoform X2 [Microcaecilia unicolor]|uniref:Uncharacterized protein KIAA2013 homolog isoform X2 n=1 Tax=Microcaecilia unicolor TaxID=1415580 RepID=A0A6P7ZY04_9AMPH|nr:uncharacterized protein KIAA2013 homolog isoform X2 [Microcaecilia unicolor]
MWLQQRLKGFPGLLSSSWARRVLAVLCFLLIVYWYLSSGSLFRLVWRSGQPSGAAGECLQVETKLWKTLSDRGDAYVLQTARDERAMMKPIVVGNGYTLVDVDSNQLWVSPTASGPAYATEYPPLLLIKPLGMYSQAQATAVLFRDGVVSTVRCIQTVQSQAPKDCVSVYEHFLCHRSRRHLCLQRIHISNPSQKVVAFEMFSLTPSLGNKFSSSPEKAADRHFLIYSGRVSVLPGKIVPLVVATKKLVDRVQVRPKSEFTETVLSVVYTSEPVESTKLEETFNKLRESAKKAMLDVMQMGTEDLFREHEQMWSDLFISGVEMRKSMDSHTPSSETVNITLYYILSSSPAPLLDPLIASEDQEKMEASLNYVDHCFAGHATMHAENLWPKTLSSVSQVLELLELWKLTLQKRGCKALVSAGAHGLMQGMVLSFGALQFTENHLQFQSDPHELHNSYALRGIHYNKDLINLAVLLDRDGKPFLHVSVKLQGKPVQLFACEAGCLNAPVELTSEVRGHTFPVMVTHPLTPLLYISTDLIHLQDLRHTLHVKTILPHEEHMAKQDPGLPFLFWFSVASLITLFHLFLFKLIYNEYCGPGAKPFFRSKEADTVMSE